MPEFEMEHIAHGWKEGGIRYKGSERIIFAERVYNTMAMWLIRDFKWSSNDALRESERFRACFVYKPDLVQLKDFLKYRRVGLRRTVSRKERIEIFLSFQNAINHSSFKES